MQRGSGNDYKRRHLSSVATALANVTAGEMSDTPQEAASGILTVASPGAQTGAEAPEAVVPKRLEETDAVEYYKRLGLGRGLDVTKRTPWLSKSSFQVRDFELKDIMQTMEGGSLQSYEREITSDQQQRSQISSKVRAVNTPVQIGVDAEQSRTYSYSRRAVGTKIINRTISFRVTFLDAPRSSTKDAGQAKEEAAVDLDHTPTFSFEEELSRWILDRVELRTKLQLRASAEDRDGKKLISQTEILRKFIGNQLGKTCKCDEAKAATCECHKTETENIQEDCKEFVSHFGISHYVCAIELGATKYRVMTEKEYSTRVAGGGSFGIEALAYGAAQISTKNEFLTKKGKRQSELKTIGKITGKGEQARVEIEEEAVVGIQIRPISSLVKTRYLELALQDALLEYTKKEERLAGPFLIVFGTKQNKAYFTVTRNHMVKGTTFTDEAKPFGVLPLDGAIPHEFTITSNQAAHYRLRCASTVTRREQPVEGVGPRSDDEDDDLEEAIPRYLEAKVDITGTNPMYRPVSMRSNIKMRDARLALQSRVLKATDKLPADITPWLKGKESFYIKCQRRGIGKKGYLCARRLTDEEVLHEKRRLHLGERDKLPYHYKLTVVSSIHAHNEEDGVYMLFRLLPSKPEVQSTPLGQGVAHIQTAPTGT